MFPIESSSYSPILRGKAGELLALQKLREPVKDRVLPTLVLPSLSIKDSEKRRVLQKQEAARAFFDRIAANWRARAFLLESRFLKFDSDPEEDAKYLSSLLSLCAKFDCKAIPAIDFKTTAARLRIYREYIENTGSGISLRLSLNDFDRVGLDERVSKILESVGASFGETALLIDLSDASIIEKRAFAELIVQGFSKFTEIGPWARVIIAASNFPEKNPAAKNNHHVVARLEWAAWKEAGQLDDRIIKLSSFGDFGADNGKIVFSDSGGGAITHLRYATQDSWLIPRGGPTTDKFDGSIRFVAARIVNSKYFAGDWFSWGDQFIADCSSGAGGPGNPTIWRAANMNHHITRAVVDVGHYLGREIEQTQERLVPVQQSLPL